MLVVLALLPPYIGLYQTQLLTYGLIAAIAALGFNLLLGYTGLLSFGHSAFFGIGAYSRRVPAARCRHPLDGALHPDRDPDRSHRVRAVRLYLRPAYAHFLRHSDARAVAGAVEPRAEALLDRPAAPTGCACRARSLLAGYVTFTGGGAFQRFVNGYYYYVLAVFAICVVIMWVIVHSPFGKALQAIRDNETRAAFLGMRIRRFRWMAFLISGTFTGLAGILWVPLNGLTTPEVLYWPFSGEIVFTALLGGFRNFTGPIVGGIALHLSQELCGGDHRVLATSARRRSRAHGHAPADRDRGRNIGVGRQAATEGETFVILLQTIDLSKQFGETRACDGVNFIVNKGEFLSLVGSNGAGKTSLVNLISAHLAPDSGQILFEGKDITFTPMLRTDQGGNCPQLPDRQSVRRTIRVRQCRAFDLLARRQDREDRGARRP